MADIELVVNRANELEQKAKMNRKYQDALKAFSAAVAKKNGTKAPEKAKEAELLVKYLDAYHYTINGLRGTTDAENKYYKDALAWEITLIQHCTTLVNAKKDKQAAITIINEHLLAIPTCEFLPLKPVPELKAKRIQSAALGAAEMALGGMLVAAALAVWMTAYIALYLSMLSSMVFPPSFAVAVCVSVFSVSVTAPLFSILSVPGDLLFRYGKETYHSYETQKKEIARVEKYNASSRKPTFFIEDTENREKLAKKVSEFEASEQNTEEKRSFFSRMTCD
ncbi:MAG: hypothetical protein P1U32_02715 [Legionellaceae bacterium]|nr:hypothetical protein [Legionellaceae bacterium]